MLNLPRGVRTWILTGPIARTLGITHSTWTLYPCPLISLHEHCGLLWSHLLSIS